MGIASVLFGATTLAAALVTVQPAAARDDNGRHRVVVRVDCSDYSYRSRHSDYCNRFYRNTGSHRYNNVYRSNDTNDRDNWRHKPDDRQKDNNYQDQRGW